MLKLKLTSVEAHSKQGKNVRRERVGLLGLHLSDKVFKSIFFTSSNFLKRRFLLCCLICSLVERLSKASVFFIIILQPLVKSPYIRQHDLLHNLKC